MNRRVPMFNLIRNVHFLILEIEKGGSKNDESLPLRPGRRGAT